MCNRVFLIISEKHNPNRNIKRKARPIIMIFNVCYLPMVLDNQMDLNKRKPLLINFPNVKSIHKPSLPMSRQCRPNMLQKDDSTLATRHMMGACLVKVLNISYRGILIINLPVLEGFRG